ncbi:hypothetical protein V8C86DRAFT_3128318, partial [Haematococcus lacustris]
MHYAALKLDETLGVRSKVQELTGRLQSCLSQLEAYADDFTACDSGQQAAHQAVKHEPNAATDIQGTLPAYSPQARPHSSASQASSNSQVSVADISSPALVSPATGWKFSTHRTSYVVEVVYGDTAGSSPESASLALPSSHLPSHLHLTALKEQKDATSSSSALQLPTPRAAVSISAPQFATTTTPSFKPPTQQAASPPMPPAAMQPPGTSHNPQPASQLPQSRPTKSASTSMLLKHKLVAGSLTGGNDPGVMQGLGRESPGTPTAQGQGQQGQGLGRGMPGTPTSQGQQGQQGQQGLGLGRGTPGTPTSQGQQGQGQGVGGEERPAGAVGVLSTIVSVVKDNLRQRGIVNLSALGSQMALERAAASPPPSTDSLDPGGGGVTPGAATTPTLPGLSPGGALTGRWAGPSSSSSPASPAASTTLKRILHRVTSLHSKRHTYPAQEDGG